MHHISLVNTTQLVGQCEDKGGIRTGPDPFFSLPNDKEKKQSGHARLLPIGDIANSSSMSIVIILVQEPS